MTKAKVKIILTSIIIIFFVTSILINLDLYFDKQTTKVNSVSNRIITLYNLDNGKVLFTVQGYCMYKTQSWSYWSFEVKCKTSENDFKYFNVVYGTSIRYYIENIENQPSGKYEVVSHFYPEAYSK